ncbi:uncharacterized protein [Temnothorax longispinosus]|uniref:uncharacterized protein isoform X2 n=1 Tax=Temnothorax longispinosus TaxID=300112 RepID=UPI003A99013F
MRYYRGYYILYFVREEAMPTCCIKNCKSYTANNAAPKNIKFYRFPRETAVRQQWLNACQRKESDIKVDSATICSIHFEENCFELVKTRPRLINDPVKEILRLKKGSIPTKFLNLENIRRKRRMLQNKKDNKKIKVPGKSFVSIELVRYAQQKERLLQEETVTKMEIDVAQNMEEAAKNMERDTLQDTNEKVTKNIDKVAKQNMEEQSKAKKQQVKQEIDDNLMQLRISQQLNRKLLDKNKNLEERIRDLSTQIAQLQAKIKNNMTKNIDKVATQNMEKQIEAIKQQVKQGIDDNLMQLRMSRELNRRLLDKNRNLKERIRDLSTQIAQLQAEIKNMTKNKHKEARAIVIDILERLDSSEDIARAVLLLKHLVT